MCASSNSRSLTRRPSRSMWRGSRRAAPPCRFTSPLGFQAGCPTHRTGMRITGSVLRPHKKKSQKTNPQNPSAASGASAIRSSLFPKPQGTHPPPRRRRKRLALKRWHRRLRATVSSGSSPWGSLRTRCRRWSHSPRLMLRTCPWSRWWMSSCEEACASTSSKTRRAYPSPSWRPSLKLPRRSSTWRHRSRVILPPRLRPKKSPWISHPCRS
mmetsp:Transcript_18494/g.46336  ORF Transcript_18494/g.46336 Transcript_18494/m.46336 type:complete len:212 (+) Transcript_18494:851-1486(+)